MACKGRSWESESGYNSSLKLPALSNHVRSGTSFDLAITLRGRLYSINYIFSKYVTSFGHKSFKVYIYRGYVVTRLYLRQPV